jgi:hypothetical protein
MSNEGASVAFMDTLNTFGGWKTILGAANAWIQYNGVDFGSNKFKSVNVKALSRAGGTLQVRLDKVDGPVIVQVEIPAGNEWNTIRARISGLETGVHDLVVSLIDNKPVEVDWVSFE